MSGNGLSLTGTREPRAKGERTVETEIKTWRSEHVGSLLRPRELAEQRVAMLHGRGDPAALSASEDRAGLEVLARQQELGLDVVGDGELRRFSFMGEIGAAMEGFAKGEEQQWAKLERVVSLALRLWGGHHRQCVAG